VKTSNFKDQSTGLFAYLSLHHMTMMMIIIISESKLGLNKLNRSTIAAEEFQFECTRDHIYGHNTVSHFRLQITRTTDGHK